MQRCCEEQFEFLPSQPCASLYAYICSCNESFQITPETTGIKFPDFKASGVTLRSQRMKLPASVGQKKLKAIEQVLEELDLGM